ncbi:MAG: baseplate J/gp47 family protein [Comamonas sp.]|jgi:phage-related baseplate assembly protein|uniref:baseplate assembly protein n=1 Tax=Comamonas sp. TaxID=34028 RepID=UPI0028275472|nr:baseplate J/gp47 family protein [Comamonas sp.]MDR0216423.1 baseplate J/gp47 family protein [Comamonas sp.]
MSNAQIIDMSKLPAPDVVVVPDFESILSDLKADMLAAMPPDLRPDVSTTLALESEPLTKWLQRLAYQLMVERSDRNDSAHAVMLAYARGSNLDQLGAFFGVVRLVIVPAQPAAIPPVAAVYEDDETFRARIQLAPRGYSVAGPVGAYVFHAKTADGQVLDAAATSPTPGRVVVSVLSRVGNGVPSQALLDAVSAAVNADDIRPLTDEVIVQAASIVNYQITGKIYTLPGPDSSSVLATAQQRVADYAESMHRIARRPTLSGIYAALHIEGVDRVELTSPMADIAVSATQASWCTAINVTHGGIVG